MANKGKATENKRKVKVFNIVIAQFVIHRRALLLTIVLLGKIYSMAAKIKNSPKNMDKRIIPSCYILPPLQNS